MPFPGLQENDVIGFLLSVSPEVSQCSDIGSLCHPLSDVTCLAQQVL